MFLSDCVCEYMHACMSACVWMGERNRKMEGGKEGRRREGRGKEGREREGEGGTKQE